jgi:hypothetical protein
MKKAVGVALIALLLGSCSRSGSKVSQPDDEFLDKVEAVCRDASVKIKKLSAGDNAPADLLEILSDGGDSLNKLVATSDLSKQWDKYTAKIDDEASALSDVVQAIAAGDSSAEQTALDSLNTAGNDADLIANALGAIRCRGLIPFNALVTDVVTDTTTTTPPTDTTTPPTESTTPPTDSTTPPTESVPPNTPLPIDTIPVTTPPPPATTATPTTILPGDLSATAIAPTGYTWIPYDPPDAAGLYSNSVIGSLVTSYDAGEFQSVTDSSITATVFVVTLSTDFIPKYTKAYEFWEAVDNGTDVVTPGGITVHQEIGAFDGIDCAVFTGKTRGMSLCTFTGTDGLSLIDQFLVANGF